jgi:hypothetical protein
MEAMVVFARACAVYNFSGALRFVLPGFLPAPGAQVPASNFWLVLPARWQGGARHPISPGCHGAQLLSLYSFSTIAASSGPFQ